MTLVLIDDDAATAVVPRVPEGSATAEHPLRDLIYARPEILLVAQLEPEIGRIVAVATELNLPGAGFIDVLLVSEYGRLIIVECKLWRNPQARREVVGQILDYARELARYGYEDLQRVISNRVGQRGNVLYVRGFFTFCVAARVFDIAGKCSLQPSVSEQLRFAVRRERCECTARSTGSR